MTVLSSQKSSLTVATILLLLLLLLAVSVPTVAVVFEEALTYEDCLALRRARPPPTSDDNPLATLTDILSKEDTVKEVDVKNKRRLGLQTTSISTTGTCCRYQSPSPSAVSIILDCNLYCKFKAVFFLSFFLRGTN